MTAQIHKLPLAGRLECPGCGASTEARCDCGVAYVPAGARAAKAVAENPGKSDRAIAAELGITHPTVAKARRATGKDLPVEPPATRTGKDGESAQVARHRRICERQGAVDPRPGSARQDALKARLGALGIDPTNASHGLSLMLEQKNRTWQLGDEGISAVGGWCQVATVNRDGVSSRVLERWTQ
jgi:hypothetical protein